MKKIAALLLALTLSIGMLAGCGGGTKTPEADSKTGSTASEGTPASGETTINKDEKVEIRLLTRMAGTNAQVDIFREVIEQFKVDYPNATILDDSQGDEAAFNNILKSDLASGKPANIYRIQGVANLAKYIDEGYILNVEPYMEEDKEWGDGFAEGALNYYRVPDKDGIYAIPSEGGLIGVYYNEKLFKEAGFDKFPETWKEFTDAIVKLKANGVTPMALGAKSTYMAGHLHNQIFYKWMGTEAAKALGSRDMKWTDPEVVKTFEFIEELVTIGAFPDGAAGLSDDMVITDFQNGKAAMMITGPWNIPKFRDEAECPEFENINLAKFPYFEEKPEFKDNDMQVISPYMISGKIEGTELELTMELAKRLTGSDIASRYANETSQLIPRNDLKLDEETLDPLFIANVDFCATSTGVAVDVFDYDPLPSMQDRTRDSVVSLFIGASPAEAAAEVQAEVDKG